MRDEPLVMRTILQFPRAGEGHSARTPEVPWARLRLGDPVSSGSSAVLAACVHSLSSLITQTEIQSNTGVKHFQGSTH